MKGGLILWSNPVSSMIE